VVDAEAVEDALADEADDRVVGPREDVRVLDTDGGELVDGEDRR
jgi:hypothetical protein